MYRCPKCHRLWHDDNARDNLLACLAVCGARLEPVPAVGSDALVGIDPSCLPYPVALTAERLHAALDRSSDVLRTLFLLKDAAETALKYAAAVLLTEYLRSEARTAERNELILKKLLRPTLGAWVGGLLDLKTPRDPA